VPGATAEGCASEWARGVWDAQIVAPVRARVNPQVAETARVRKRTVPVYPSAGPGASSCRAARPLSVAFRPKAAKAQCVMAIRAHLAPIAEERALGTAPLAEVTRGPVQAAADGWPEVSVVEPGHPDLLDRRQTTGPVGQGRSHLRRSAASAGRHTPYRRRKTSDLAWPSKHARAR
jgi:hypothetical protein